MDCCHCGFPIVTVAFVQVAQKQGSWRCILALIGKPVTAQRATELPFGGLGVSLAACEEYADTLEVQVFTWAPVSFCDGMFLYEPPVALSGYRLLTALGCEIRGR